MAETMRCTGCDGSMTGKELGDELVGIFLDKHGDCPGEIDTMGEREMPPDHPSKAV